jgi:predicted Rossmann fold flavoprotein
VSDRAFDISGALEKYMKQLGISVVRDGARDLIVEDGVLGGVCGERGNYEAKRVIIATGGVSYPLTGSTGDGYELAKSVGHSIVEPRGSLVPLCAGGDLCQKLQGLSLRNVGLRVFENKKKIYDDFGEMLFTHFGVSGPLILSASSHMRKFGDATYRLEIDLKPALDEAALDKRVLADFAKYANSDFVNALNDLLPQKMIPVIVELSGIDPRVKVHEITREQRKVLLQLLKRFPVRLSALRPVSEAVVTAGGISVKEINPKTMESKLCEGLYFAGEVIDCDALTGGYNLQIAWSTAAAAARGIAWS